MQSRLEETLRRVPFFRDLSKAELTTVVQSGSVQRLTENEILFCEADPAPGLFVLITGRVKLYKLDARGRELTLGLAERGDVIGAPATFDGGNCPYHAAAVAEGTSLFAIDASRFHELLSTYPIISVGVVRFLAIQNRRLIEMLKAQTLHSVRARFASYLLHAAGDAHTFTLPESNAGIAAHLGTVREVVSRTLHQFADMGYITLTGRTVTIISPNRLQEVAANNAVR